MSNYMLMWCWLRDNCVRVYIASRELTITLSSHIHVMQVHGLSLCGWYLFLSANHPQFTRPATKLRLGRALFAERLCGGWGVGGFVGVT